MLRTPFMHCDRRLAAAGLMAAASLAAAPAGAQPAPPPAPAAALPPTPPPAPPTAPPPPTESLETPYHDPPPPDLSPPPLAAPPAPTPPKAGVIRLDVPDIRPPLPIIIRERRRLALTGEIGWNGLAGFGPVLTYYAHPHVALDLGLGFSLLGAKAGLRTRYLFLESPLTPFIGAGINATSGLGKATSDPAQNPESNPNREPVTVNVEASYLVQAVMGIDYIHRRGFTLIASAGYAHLLNDDNYQVLAGELTDDERRGFDIAFGGGLVLSIAMGYAFE